MRRTILFAIVVMLLAGCALADAGGGYWTSNEDWYYHANRRCGGAEGMVPISAAAAEAFDKYICPVCIQQQDAGEDIQAVARGGTIVIRFSDAWLNGQKLTGVFGWSSDSVRAGEEGERMLAEYLHGDAYNSFLADYNADGTAEGRANMPALLDIDGELIMNERHIGSAWYITVRPAENFGSDWEMYWRVDSLKLKMEEGELRSNFDRQTIETERRLELGRMEDTKPVYEYSGSGLEIAVYRAMDANVAVIREENSDEDFLQGVQLRIGGSIPGIETNGYMSGGSGIFCCVLTEGELERMKSGAAVELWRRPLTETAVYMNTPYAEVRRGTGDVGIIDEAGNFVVDPVYRDITRPHPDSFRISEPRPFFCIRMDGGMDILHGETLERIASYDAKEANIGAEYVNPSLYFLYDGSGRKICFLQNGAFLFEMKYDESGNYAGEVTSLDGYFRVRADGLPRRMVAWKGSGADAKAWLMDNSGARINQDNYQRITPMVWNGNEGLFLTETFDASAYEYSFDGSKQDSYVFGNSYDGGAYGKGWRCGLIDQNGKTIAEMEYICAEADENGCIRLTDESGKVHSFQIGN